MLYISISNLGLAGEITVLKPGKFAFSINAYRDFESLRKSGFFGKDILGLFLSMPFSAYSYFFNRSY